MENQFDELLNKFKKFGFPIVSKDLKEILNDLEKHNHFKDLKDLLKKLDCHNELRKIKEKLKKLADHEKFDDLRDVIRKLDCHKEFEELRKKLEKLGKQEEFKDFYDALKKLGALIEFELNERIQNRLNKKEIIEFLHQHSHGFSKVIDGLKELVETISIPLNIPTKNDVANVAKLTIHNEEKLEAIEEQLKTLNHYLKELTDGKTPSETLPTTPGDDEDFDRKLKKYKKLLLLHAILQSSSNHGSKKE